MYKGIQPDLNRPRSERALVRHVALHVSLPAASNAVDRAQQADIVCIRVLLATGMADHQRDVIGGR